MRIGLVSGVFLIAAAVLFSIAGAKPAAAVQPPGHESVWAHNNLVAWCVAPWDAKKRGPEEIAQMLAKLGFKHFSYIQFSEEDNTADLDAQIEALNRHGIELDGAYLTEDADAPLVKKTLEVFKRHGIHPQLWVVLSPKGPGEEDMPKSASEQRERIAQETDRVQALVAVARPYGVKVELYNHTGWFGMMENQLAIIQSLKQRGVTDVGIVYNFSHARDALHDDSKNFQVIWKKIKPYTVAVNITGLRGDAQSISYPSQGDSELEMMRIIQDSGWRGRVGVIAEKGGDAEVTLSNYLVGLDWLVAELNQPGSGGPLPFPQ